MSGTPSTFVRAVKLVVDAAQDQRITFLAASVAYYAFVSLIPALLLLVVVASSVLGESFASQLLAMTGDFLTPAGEEAIGTAIESAQGRSGATIVGFVVLLWSTLKVFRGLDTAFLQVYGVEERVTIVDQLIDAVSVVIGIGVGILVMIGVGTFVAAVDALPALEVASIVLLPLFLTVVFLPMYYLLPYPQVTIREALPGAAFAAVGWSILQTGFQVYAAQAAQYQVYGVIGGILLLVTWLYIAAIVVMLGAVINVVLAEHREPGFTRKPEAAPLAPEDVTDRQLQQGSVRLTDMEGESDRATEEGDEERPRGAPDVASLEEEVRRLRADLDEFESDVERRTVDRPNLESELKAYVRSRMRRGHARGWGPYLVLLYGTILTLGAFHYLEGIYAVAAIVVLGLSTLGLYVVFIVVGLGLNALGAPGKALDYVRSRRED